ncbi:MAG TPA: SDR family oxidoreductase [Burkholderiaceae bacterium]|nr:SDR family oxidoreductase [Burkholderiaceae bacterium]
MAEAEPMVQERTSNATTSDELAGQVVLVTGGARGLGAQIAEAAMLRGATAIVCDLREDAAQACASKLESMRGPQGKGRAYAIGLDVGDDAQVRDVINRVVGREGRLDAVINNAAIDITVPVDELEAKDWERIVQTNLTGPFYIARHAAKVMRERGSGHIVNIASTASKRAWPNASAYHATKWGLLGLSHALHAELRPYGVKVTAIVSGGMRTPFLLDRFPDIDLQNLMDPAHVAKTVMFVLGTPAEVVVPEVMILPMRETSWP